MKWTISRTTLLRGTTIVSPIPSARTVIAAGSRLRSGRAEVRDLQLRDGGCWSRRLSTQPWPTRRQAWPLLARLRAEPFREPVFLMSVIKKQVVMAALEGIDTAIKRLWEPRGTATYYDPGVLLGKPTPLTHPGMRPHGTYNMYAMGLDDYQRTDPPWMWPEVIELTESFVGAALVIAQEYIADGAGPKGQYRDICDLANFWKHRGT